MSKDFPKRDIVERTFKFSVQIVGIVNLLPRTPPGIAIANQIIRSGTSIGANMEEAQDAFSRNDFLHAVNISLKEARETFYWLKIIDETNLTSKEQLLIAMQENTELIKILTTIVKNTKKG